MHNLIILKQLTHPSMVLRTSESMLFAKRTEPVSPNNGINRVLLFPGIGHFATTTIDPRTNANPPLLTTLEERSDGCCSSSSTSLASSSSPPPPSVVLVFVFIYLFKYHRFAFSCLSLSLSLSLSRSVSAEIENTMQYLQSPSQDQTKAYGNTLCMDLHCRRIELFS